MDRCAARRGVGHRIADERYEQRDAHADVPDVRVGGADAALHDVISRGERDAIGDGQCGRDHRRLRPSAASYADHHLSGEHIRRVTGRIASCGHLHRHDVRREPSGDTDRHAAVG